MVKIEQINIVKVDELAPFIPFKAGATFSQLWQVFYYTRLFKYVHRRHYPKIKVSYNKICTDRNLHKLCELGYFKSPQKDVYCAANKVLPILKKAGFIADILPAEPQGKGDGNELHNTEVFIQAIKLPYFYILLFPQFKQTPDSPPHLIPDALLVQKDDDYRRYKLTFLEVEAKKPGWEHYLEKKRDNYLKLSKDINFYNYWKKTCIQLQLPIPEVAKLKFSVFFVGNIKKNFGNGFQFLHTLSGIS